MKLDAKQALILAVEGYPANRAEPISFWTISMEEGRDNWTIYFNPKDSDFAAPGQHFILLVNKETGKLTLLPGE